MTRRHRATQHSEKDRRTFLKMLRDLLQIDRQNEFSRLCKKEPPNISNYLNGERSPGISVLQDCLLNATISRVFKDSTDRSTQLGRRAKKLRDEVYSELFGAEIQVEREVEPIPDNASDLPSFGGLFVLYDSAGNVLYIGKAKSFRVEVWRTLYREIPIGIRLGPSMRKSRPMISDLACYLSLYKIENADLRHNIEALLIRVFINQTHNSNIGNFT